MGLVLRYNHPTHAESGKNHCVICDASATWSATNNPIRGIWPDHHLEGFEPGGCTELDVSLPPLPFPCRLPILFSWHNGEVRSRASLPRKGLAVEKAIGRRIQNVMVQCRVARCSIITYRPKVSIYLVGWLIGTRLMLCFDSKNVHTQCMSVSVRDRSSRCGDPRTHRLILKNAIGHTQLQRCAPYSSRIKLPALRSCP